MIRNYRRPLLMVAIATVLPGQAPAAQPSAAVTDISPAETFRKMCVAHGARMDAVVEAARAAGFGPAATVPAPPAGFTKVVALERGSGTARQVLVVSIGKSAVSKALSVEVPARACAVTAFSGGWDVRTFAREWTGLSPQFDAEGTTLYSYFERPSGNAPFPDEDLPRLVAGVNAGELRSLAVADRRGLRALSWVVFEAPPTPVVVPTAKLSVPSHDTDPFAPCRWENSGKGRSMRRSLSCPDKAGTFRPTFAKGLTEETPGLARGGDVAAMLRLATFYADGPQVARDPASAFSWSKRAADAGAPAGVFNIGLAYDDGIGVATDKAEAARWYRIATDRGHAPAMINLAALLLTGSSTERAASAESAAALVRRAADAGSIDGLFDMGHLSESGTGVTKDMAEAQRWYRLAADRKDSRAMLRLGLIHADGIGGVPRDDAEGARWLVAGVTPSLGLATAIMGIEALVHGFDNPKRRAEIARAAATDPAVALRLGIYLADRKNPGRDPAEALRLLRIAADARIPLAALRIGVMYAEGDGVPKNGAEAISWLRSDARLRTIDAFQRVTKFKETPEP